jgi:hypothetical protein
MWLIEQAKPGLIVELGTETGVSLAAMCQAIAALKLSTAVYAVDTWKGDANTGPYDEEVHADLQSYLKLKKYDFVTTLRSNFDDALDEFKDGSIDLLHIDGCHIYEAVRHDFESWKPKLSDRGIVMLHDTTVRRDDFGVWRFWESMRREFPSFGFEHSFGLGVLLVGKDQPPTLRRLAESAQSGAVSFSSAEALAVFSALGEAIIDIADRDTALQRAEALVTERNAALSKHQAALSKAQAIVADRSTALSEHQAALAKAQAIVAERNASLREHEAARAKLVSRLSSRRSYMIAQERQLRTAEEALRAANLLADERLSALEAAQARRNQLEAVASHRLALLRVERELRLEAEADRVSPQERAETAALIADLRYEIAETNAARASAEILVAELRSDIGDRDDALRRREAAIDELRAQIAQLTSSASWRITAPLRALLVRMLSLRRGLRWFTRSADRARLRYR